MAHFYIHKIKITGAQPKDTIIYFNKGVNIIYGPSNSGKSMLFRCIDFIFGSNSIPFSLDTGYDTVEVTFENNNKEKVCIKRSITLKKNEEKAGKISIESTFDKIKSVNSINSKNYKLELLKLLGIEVPPVLIKTLDFKLAQLSIRSLFHFYFLSEDRIFLKKVR